jgi:hypothetical protein
VGPCSEEEIATAQEIETLMLANGMVMVCVLERDVDLDAAGRDVSCVVRLHARNQAPSSPFTDVDVIPPTDHPDDPRALYRARRCAKGLR